MDNYISAPSHNYEIVLADVCLPDYWSGHHLAHFSIPVNGTTTFKSVKDSLKVELAECAIAGIIDYEVTESCRFHKNVTAAINRLKPVNKYARLAFPELDKFNDDDSDGIHAYFVIIAH